MDYVMKVNLDDSLYLSIVNEPIFTQAQIEKFEDTFSFVNGGKFYRDFYKQISRKINENNEKGTATKYSCLISHLNTKTLTKNNIILASIVRDENTKNNVLREANICNIFKDYNLQTEKDDHLRPASFTSHRNSLFAREMTFLLNALEKSTDGDLVFWIRSELIFKVLKTEKEIINKCIVSIEEHPDILFASPETGGAFNSDYDFIKDSFSSILVKNCADSRNIVKKWKNLAKSKKIEFNHER
jgi:hypothetical protein